MSRIYKVFVIGSVDVSEIFVINPYMECLSDGLKDEYDSFMVAIYRRMPELITQISKIYYEDAEGDRITILNVLDFKIFEEQNIEKVFVVKRPNPEAVRSATTKNAVPTTLLATSICSQAENPTGRTCHSDVICRICAKQVFGNRYSCLECIDFDLCKGCGSKTHNHHLMVRVADPIADIWENTRWRLDVGKEINSARFSSLFPYAHHFSYYTYNSNPIFGQSPFYRPSPVKLNDVMIVSNKSQLESFYTWKKSLNTHINEADSNNSEQPSASQPTSSKTDINFGVNKRDATDPPNDLTTLLHFIEAKTREKEAILPITMETSRNMEANRSALSKPSSTSANPSVDDILNAMTKLGLNNNEGC